MQSRLSSARHDAAQAASVSTKSFTRLSNLNLLLVRPQRATVVRPFSRQLIANARFVRAAVELEVIRSATMYGAQALHEPKGEEIQFGVIRAGLLADLLIVEENPLHNMKVLYGTGAVKLNDETGKPERVGGVKYTIKDGIVYDAKQLLEDVKQMVDEQKAELGDLVLY